MGIEHQLHRVSVDISKGYRQIERYASLAAKGDTDRAIMHLTSAINDFSAAIDHAAKAEDDAATKAGSELDKGNADLQKAIDSYADGNADAAQRHYESAVTAYGKAIDLLD